MTLSDIIKILSTAEGDPYLSCHIDELNFTSNIYVVGQVKPNTPGAVLGDREAHHREKQSISFIGELNSFGDNFHDQDFLLEHTYQVDELSYELRYFLVEDIDINSEKAVLVARSGELLSLREQHDEPEFE
ncbi:hypothetical protein [Pseudoalteromonas prydzensis]|uniref:hypothetical protein n=1 Tax=Pseudoalteromonas prydzensis TaxID=182141 RepID=UPI0007E50D1E|nr:hypothetical protein [Pseudoalteromonas prydzensis]MBE0377566.1 hypothetical protein [Pseudoalteromonas prydzensis ACAM 620]